MKEGWGGLGRGLDILEKLQLYFGRKSHSRSMAFNRGTLPDVPRANRTVLGADFCTLHWLAGCCMRCANLAHVRHTVWPAGDVNRFGGHTDRQTERHTGNFRLVIQTSTYVLASRAREQYVSDDLLTDTRRTRLLVIVLLFYFEV